MRFKPLTYGDELLSKLQQCGVEVTATLTPDLEEICDWMI
jgi:hypothetical protein